MVSAITIRVDKPPATRVIGRKAALLHPLERRWTQTERELNIPRPYQPVALPIQKA